MTPGEFEAFLQKNVAERWISSYTATMACRLVDQVHERLGRVPTPWRMSTGPWEEVVIVWKDDLSRLDAEVPSYGPVTWTHTDLETRENQSGIFYFHDDINKFYHHLGNFR